MRGLLCIVSEWASVEIRIDFHNLWGKTVALEGWFHRTYGQCNIITNYCVWHHFYSQHPLATVHRLLFQCKFESNLHVLAYLIHILGKLTNENGLVTVFSHAIFSSITAVMYAISWYIWFTYKSIQWQQRLMATNWTWARMKCESLNIGGVKDKIPRVLLWIVNIHFVTF